MPLLGVVFDFDGVIADTEALHLRAYQETLAERGLSLSETEYLERYLGYDDVGVVTAVGRDHGVVLEDSEITRLIETKGHRFESLVGTDHVLFAGSAECIRRLASQTTLAIASGALHDEIERILTANALRQYFEVIVAADDVERPKPAPDGYLRAVSHLSRDPRRTSSRAPTSPSKTLSGVSSPRVRRGSRLSGSPTPTRSRA